MPHLPRFSRNTVKFLRYVDYRDRVRSWHDRQPFSLEVDDLWEELESDPVDLCETPDYQKASDLIGRKPRQFQHVVAHGYRVVVLPSYNPEASRHVRLFKQHILNPE